MYKNFTQKSVTHFPIFSILSVIRILTLLVATLAIVTISTDNVSAADATKFNAGNIISDADFYNSPSMTTPQIQSFLNSKVSSCDTNGTKPATEYGRPDLTHAQYAKLHGWSAPPYTCIKDYSITTATKASDAYCNGYSSSKQSAAQIINGVAKSCGVNPQVLIVLLQKEQGLITDTWPLSSQYRSATGMGCPDTAACDSQYYGLFNQLYYAARQFKLYRAMPSSYSYVAGRNNTILWNPSSSCGTSTVYIQNQATAGLYNYTPYRPNSAALAAGYGTGNSCSSYGNRNFWLYYNDWFGSSAYTPFVTNNGKIYILGASNTYYYVPNVPVLKSFGYTTTFKNLRSISTTDLNSMTSAGRLSQAVRFEGSAIYAMDQSKLRHFTSQSDYNAYGFNVGDESDLSADLLPFFSNGSDVTLTARTSTEPQVYSIEVGKKRHITTSSVYNTLGTPVYSTRAVSTFNSTFLSSIADGAPILDDNTVVKASDTNKLYLWQSGSLLQIPSSASPASSYTSKASLLAQLPSGGNMSDYIKVSTSYYYINGANAYLLGSQPSTSQITDTTSAFLSKFSQKNFSNIKFVRHLNESTVYKIEGTNLYKVYSRGDLSKLGGTLNDVVSLTNHPFSTFSSSNSYMFPIGTIFRINNGAKIYIADGEFSMKHIPSRALASAMGININSARNLTTADVSEYTDGGALTYIMRQKSNNQLWLIGLLRRYHVTNEMKDSSYTTITPTQVTDALVATLTNGGLAHNLLRSETGVVYKITNGIKQAYASRKAFERTESWSDVINVSNELISKFPQGATIR